MAHVGQEIHHRPQLGRTGLQIRHDAVHIARDPQHGIPQTRLARPGQPSRSASIGV
jgi:hypothetical protein